MSLEIGVEPVTAPGPVADVKIATSADEAAWDRFVAQNPHATGYHEWAWRQVFARAFGHEPIYLMAAKGDRIEGILPLVYIKSFLFGRVLASLPFLNYGGIVADGDTAARGLVEMAVDIGRSRRCRHVELRHQERRFPTLP